jgi:hypothetical protein
MASDEVGACVQDAEIFEQARELRRTLAILPCFHMKPWYRLVVRISRPVLADMFCAGSGTRARVRGFEASSDERCRGIGGDADEKPQKGRAAAPLRAPPAAVSLHGAQSTRQGDPCRPAVTAG